MNPPPAGNNQARVLGRVDGDPSLVVAVALTGICPLGRHQPGSPWVQRVQRVQRAPQCCCCGYFAACSICGALSVASAPWGWREGCEAHPFVHCERGHRNPAAQSRSVLPQRPPPPCEPDPFSPGCFANQSVFLAEADPTEDRPRRHFAQTTASRPCLAPPQFPASSASVRFTSSPIPSLAAPHWRVVYLDFPRNLPKAC